MLYQKKNSLSCWLLLIIISVLIATVLGRYYGLQCLHLLWVITTQVYLCGYILCKFYNIILALLMVIQTSYFLGNSNQVSHFCNNFQNYPHVKLFGEKKMLAEYTLMKYYACIFINYEIILHCLHSTVGP